VPDDGKTDRSRTAAQIRVRKARQFKEVFPRACDRILAEFGAKPFNPRGQLNTSILDAVFITVLESDRPLASDLKARYAKLVGDPEFTSKTRRATTDTATVYDRIAMAKNVLTA
jgi:hypothetical protein